MLWLGNEAARPRSCPLETMNCLSQNLAALTKEQIAIPPMPTVLSRVMSALRDPNVNIADLAKVLREDPGLTGQLLKVANSPLYGLARRVKTLEQAVMLLGLRALRSLVVGESTRMMYARSEPISQELWVHSRGVAIAAHVVARVARVGNRDEAFVGGLLHDIGKALLLRAAPEDYKRVVREVAERGIESQEAEREILSLTHMEAGSLLVQQWGLSEDLEHVVRSTSS
jgi:HD-like signal output (HDOD) protein